MDWPGESPPVNVPDCGYRGEKCEKPTANDYSKLCFIVSRT